jgi:hypothetical protein
MITESEYLDLKNKYNAYAIARELVCGKRNYVTLDDQKLLPEPCTNEEISQIEVYEFVTKFPEEYLLYVNEEKCIVTTWTGEKLGRCILGREYNSNMGDNRRSIKIWGINHKEYYGTYYQSTGDYARVKMYK